MSMQKTVPLWLWQLFGDILFGEMPSLRVRLRRFLTGLVFFYCGLQFAMFQTAVDDTGYDSLWFLMLVIGFVYIIGIYTNWCEHGRLRQRGLDDPVKFIRLKEAFLSETNFT